MRRQRLIDERERQQLSQEELARKAGLSRSAYLRIESGATEVPHRSTRRKLRDALNLTEEGITQALFADDDLAPTAVTHRDASLRYSPSNLPIPGTAFTADHDVNWEAYRLDRRFAVVPAGDDVAGLLDITGGTLVLRREFVFWAGDVPQQQSVSYLPAALTAGSPVEDPANEPWPGGTIAQLALLGKQVSRIRETVRARMPTNREERTLRIPRGVPVMVVTRTMFAGSEPVEAAVDIVMPADRHTLDYEINPRRGSSQQ